MLFTGVYKYKSKLSRHLTAYRFHLGIYRKKLALMQVVIVLTM